MEMVLIVLCCDTSEAVEKGSIFALSLIACDKYSEDRVQRGVALPIWI